MKVQFRIHPTAVEFIRRMLDGASVEMVLVVVGFVRGTHRVWASDKWDARPFDHMVEAARKTVADLPSKVLVDYVIGIKELDRVPLRDVHVVDGIKCYIPEDMIEVIGEREIVLDNGVLRFEPRIDPFEIERPSDKPTSGNR